MIDKHIILVCLVHCLAGCSSDGPASGADAGQTDICAEVQCDDAMTCDPADGECKCGSEVCAEGEKCDPAASKCRIVLPDRCTAGTAWTEGHRAFEEASSDWGLPDLSVEGVRLSVTDIDGDGFADLSSRRAGTAADNFEETGGSRVTWLLRNEAGSGFTDVTRSSGFVQPRRGENAEVGRPGEVVAWADVDNDGDLDAFTGMTNYDPASPQIESSEIMLNNGDGTFLLGPEDSAVRREGEFVAPAGASFTDFDRDGRIDLWITYSAVKDGNPDQDRLYRGKDGVEFEDVTYEAKLGTLQWQFVEDLNEALCHSWAWSSAACDLNGDGTPELLAASYGRAPNLLWQGGRREDGAVTYVNRSIASGYAFDANMDWTDNESARCYCKLHRDAEDCADVPLPRYVQCRSDADVFRWDHDLDREPFRLGGNSGTTVCADVNNDGAIDLLTTEIQHWDVGLSSDMSELLLNAGGQDVTFTRPGNAATGIEWEHDTTAWDDGDMSAAVFDFDNDARPDVYIGSSDYPGTRGRLFHQKEDGTFEELSIEEGIDHKSSHGVAVADFDRDGDLDLIAGHSKARCNLGNHCYPSGSIRFFRNIAGQDGNWIQLRLAGGEKTNQAAIGARVTVKAGEKTQTQEVGGGHGHYGIQHDLTLHFGLGSACEAEVTVRWPDKNLTEQTFRVQTGYRYTVAQGEEPEAEL